MSWLFSYKAFVIAASCSLYKWCDRVTQNDAICLPGQRAARSSRRSIRWNHWVPGCAKPPWGHLRDVVTHRGTLNNPEDICRNILTFYEAVQSTINDTMEDHYVHPMADPYELPTEFVSKLSQSHQSSSWPGSRTVPLDVWTTLMLAFSLSMCVVVDVDVCTSVSHLCRVALRHCARFWQAQSGPRMSVTLYMTK